MRRSRCFNSRTPGGVRRAVATEGWSVWEFQFTHPGRGATSGDNIVGVPSRMFQFTHPGRGATESKKLWSSVLRVSIHAPREGCDWIVSLVSVLTVLFQFTHPGRGATACKSTAPSDQAVSIHAPREGCDVLLLLTLLEFSRFNSRTPGGVRHRVGRSLNKATEFQFTHPGRGATHVADSRFHPQRGFQFTHPGRGATSA